MSKTPAEFLKNLQKISLQQEEKITLRKNVVSFMRAHPLLNTQENQPGEQRLDVFTLFTFFLRKPAFVALSLALVLSLGTGISYAAAESLPGDALYFIKVNINEEVPKLFLPQEEKARWEVKRAAKRIQEATDLALKGQLTEEATREVQKQLAAHTANISEITTSLKAQGEAQAVTSIHTELQAALSANEEIFVAVASEQNTAEAEPVVAAIALVEEASKNESTNAVIALVSIPQAEEKALAKVAQEAKIEVEQETQAVQQTIKNVPSENTVAQKFAATQTIKEEGNRRLQEGSVKESVALFQEAKTRAEEINVLVERAREQPHIARIIERTKPALLPTPEIPPAAAETKNTTPQPIPAKIKETIPQPSLETPIAETPKTEASESTSYPQQEQIIVPSKPVIQEARVNTPPKIISYPPVQIGPPQSEMRFVWEAFDPEGDTLQWNIWWGDRDKRETQAVCESITCSRVNASHAWDGPGSYTVRVRVADGKGELDSYSFTVTIQAGESLSPVEATPPPPQTEEQAPRPVSIRRRER